MNSANAVVDSFAQAEQRIIQAGNNTKQFANDVKNSSNQATQSIKKVSAEAAATARKQQEGFQKLVENIEKANRAAKPLEDQLTELGVAFAEAFDNQQFDRANSIFSEILNVQKQITSQVEKQAQAQEKAAEEAKRAAVAAEQQTQGQLQAVLGAAVSGDGSSQLQVEKLQEEVDNLTAKLNDAGLAEGERVKLQNELAERQKELTDAQNRNLDNSRKLVSTVAQTVGEIFLPGFGGIIGQLTDQLARGPEEAAAFVTGLIKGIPQIIENIALATPEIIIALAEAMPEVAAALAVEVPVKLTRALVERAPDIIAAQVKAVPRLVEAFAKSIASTIFKVDFDFNILKQKFETLVEDIKTSLSTFFGGLGDIFSGFGNVVADAGSSFFKNVIEGAQKFVEEILNASTGGLLGGTGDDRGLSTRNISVSGARNTGQELLNRSGLGGLLLTGGAASRAGATGSGFTTRQLELFGQTIGEEVSESIRELSAESLPPVIIRLQVGQSELSNVLVNLKKNGFRTE